MKYLDYQTHLTIIHPKSTEEEEPSNLQCKLCNNNLEYSREELKAHIDKEHPISYYGTTKKNGRRCCPICLRDDFKNNWHLKRHLDTFHKLGALIQCTVCKKEFRFNDLLRKHYQQVHKNLPLPFPAAIDKEGPFKCQHCNRSLKRKSSLTLHMSTCNGLNNNCYKCRECDKVFKYRATRDLHFKNEHLKETHLCCECGKCFFSTSKLSFTLSFN